MTPWKRKEVIGDCTLYLGDCMDVMPTLPSVNMVMTSPPYDGLREYGENFVGLDWRKAISQLSSLLSEGGVMVWNVADQTVNGSESGTSFRQALYAMDCGLRLHDTMIYCKEGVTYLDANRYHPAFEYMFVFSKGAPSYFEGIKDWKNKWGGSKMHGTDRNPDGTTSKINGHGNLVPDYGLRRNWWVISNPYTGETKGHPAPMPYSMAYDHISTWSKPSDIVFDPFMGSGTTAVAALKQGRKFVGTEVDETYFGIACERIRKAHVQPDMFVSKPKATETQEGLTF